MLPLPPVSQALILINVGMFCLQIIFGFQVDILLALWPVGGGFLPWQVVTYAFLHGGIGHLVFNMLALWMFGGELETLWGRKRYLQFLAASAVTAAACQLAYAALGSGGPVVGASGATFGLLIGYAMTFPTRTISPLFPPIPVNARVYVAIFGGLELLYGVTGTRNGIAHFAHLGGMLGGWLMIRYWRGQSPFSRKRR